MKWRGSPPRSISTLNEDRKPIWKANYFCGVVRLSRSVQVVIAEMKLIRAMLAMSDYDPRTGDTDAGGCKISADSIVLTDSVQKTVPIAQF